MSETTEIVTLSNGLRVLCDYSRQAESAALGVWIAVGSRLEASCRQGISHFLEHMLFKGTQRRSHRRIAREIEGRGGVLNGFTSEEHTCYWAAVRSGRFLSALDLLFDLVWHPRLDSAEIEKEKGVVKEEIRLYRDHPAHYAAQLIQETMWPDQPLGRPVLGTEKSVEDLQRNDLVRHQRACHRPSRMVLAVCGNAPPDKVFRAVSKIKALAPGASPPRLRCARFSSAPKARVASRPIEQAHLCLGFKGLARSHPERFTLALLNIILGGNMSSRLFQEMREKKGWAYSVASHLNFYYDSGDLVVTAGILPARAAAGAGLILKEIEKLVLRPVSLPELNRAREYFWGRTILEWEKTVSRMLTLGEHLISLNEVLRLEEIEKEIKQITPERIRSLAASIFKPGAGRLALVGPADVSGEVAAGWMEKGK